MINLSKLYGLLLIPWLNLVLSLEPTAGVGVVRRGPRDRTILNWGTKSYTLSINQSINEGVVMHNYNSLVQ